MSDYDYDRDLRRRQAEHLRGVRDYRQHWQPCLHDQCPECVGTGVRRDGSACVHSIACSCPKCSVTCGVSYGSVTANSVPLAWANTEWAEVTL